MNAATYVQAAAFNTLATPADSVDVTIPNWDRIALARRLASNSTGSVINWNAVRIAYTAMPISMNGLYRNNPKKIPPIKMNGNICEATMLTGTTAMRACKGT